MAEVQRLIAVDDIVGAGSNDAVTVRIPLTFRKRGGRKIFIAPDGASLVPPLSARFDNAVIKAIARAFRWRQLLETGVYATVEGLAAAEKINASYVSRILCLTLLAPAIVEAILDGRQPVGVTLAGLMKGVPMVWREQQLSGGRVEKGQKKGPR
jgi:hypothetical protein